MSNQRGKKARGNSGKKKFLDVKGYKRMTANRFFELISYLQQDKKYMLYNDLLIFTMFKPGPAPPVLTSNNNKNTYTMIYNKEINGVKFTFVCESWKTRNSWGHQVTLYKNDTFKVGRVKIRYYNRTWESYLYQSAIKSVIYNAIEEIKTAAKVAFKALHDYKVMTKKRAAEFTEYLTKDPAYNMYNELYRMF